jgi:hypothetical protein
MDQRQLHVDVVVVTGSGVDLLRTVEYILSQICKYLYAFSCPLLNYVRQ